MAKTGARTCGRRLGVISGALLLIALSSCRHSEMSGVQDFSVNSVRRTASPQEAAYVVHVDTGCTGYFVANSQNRTILGTASHCFHYDPTSWCANGGVVTDHQGVSGKCKMILATAPFKDSVFFEATFPSPPLPAQTLFLANYVPPVNTRLKMIGYPADVERSGQLTVTENCWVLSGTIPSPYINRSGAEASTDPSAVHNCSTYGGNSGGPMLAEGTRDVVGLPYTYAPDGIVPVAVSIGNGSEDLMEMAAAVQTFKVQLAAAGVQLSEALPPAVTANEPLDALQQSFVQYCQSSPLPADEQVTLQAVLQLYSTQDCTRAARYFTSAFEISLAGTQIANATILRYARSVQALYLGQTKITTLPSLKDLANLKILDLSGNKITTLDATADLKQLSSLNLSSTGLTSLTQIPATILGQLTDLDLSGNAITDIKALQGRTLTSLNLSDNAGGNGDAFVKTLATGGTFILGSLWLSGLGITDLSPLATDPKLLSFLGAASATASLNLSNNAIKDISALKFAGVLPMLVLAQNQLSDLSPLAGLSSLKALFLDQNLIESVAPLKGLTGLTSLTLSGNHLGDTTPLAGLTALTTLDLSNNPSPVPACPVAAAICTAGGG